jgi:hypothetical protein
MTNLDFSYNDLLPLPDLCKKLGASLSAHPLSQLFHLDEEREISQRLDLAGVQDSFRFRALSRARALSQALIDDKGELNLDELNRLLFLFEKEGEIFTPLGYDDARITEGTLRVLSFLTEEKNQRLFKRFQAPLCHQWAERIVLDTLALYTAHQLTDCHVRRAVLCAALTPLRQNVGSCFATAPAILVQREQLELFFDDLYQLLSTGKLKRIFSGKEYTLPLSPTTGIGDLRKTIESHTDSYGIEIALKALALSPRKPSAKATVETFLHRILLEESQLTEEDLKKARRLEAEQLKNIKGSFHAASPHMLDRIESFKRKENCAQAAFKGVCDNALLKAWEFTLASFSEVKMEFSRWNLYSSLGFAHEEEGGIGQVIYHNLEIKIETAHQQIKEFQKEYELAFDQVRGTETLLRQAGSEQEARRLQAEHQSRVYHMRTCLEMRDRIHDQASHLSELYSFLLKQYDEKFPEYFQEIYDAKMHDFKGDFYDDSPAGFRLVYKHGRPDPSLWTLVYDEEEYIQSLVDFFSSTEAGIAALCEWEGGEKEVLEITSSIISHLRTSFFIETALQRMKKAHGNAKPWAYISGGTMTTLIKTYCCRENELTQEARWVENEAELAIFFLDVMKHLPPRITQSFLKDPRKGMLSSSPSHAFLFLPGHELFRAGWQESGFTYTWVRDEIFLPGQKFYAQMNLSSDEQLLLLERFSHELPPLIGHQLQQRYPLDKREITILSFRNQLLSLLGSSQTIVDAIDAFLYRMLPLIPGHEWKTVVRRLLSDLMNDEVEEKLMVFPEIPAAYLTSSDLIDLAKACFLISRSTLYFPFDLHQFIATHARFIGLRPPAPLLFADTNWVNHLFGFVVNPGTQRLELWRLDPTATQGTPISEWKRWLNGTDRKLWTVYSHPHEYEVRKYL